MSVFCKKVNIAGAVYYLNDIIVFELYKALTSDQQYLKMILTKDDETAEAISVFDWNDVPSDVLNIYKYVASTSYITYTEGSCYKLMGNHIGRIKDYKMHIFSSLDNPLEEGYIINLANVTNKSDAFVKEISQNMTIVKKLAE
jgi:hypothetical protein